MKRTFTLFVLLLVTEIAIAVFYFHKFIRGFIGDVLVIPLLYFFLRLFLKWKTRVLIILVASIAIGVELLQLYNITEKLAIRSQWLKTIIGTTFDGKDIIAYLLGALLIFLFEKNSTYESN